MTSYLSHAFPYALPLLRVYYQWEGTDHYFEDEDARLWNR